MENENMGKGQYCPCPNCQWASMGHKHFWLRWFLMLVILGLVFCVGVKVGEFKSFLESGFGGGYGGMWGHHNLMYKQGPPMMYYWNQQSPPPSSSTNTPTK